MIPKGCKDTGVPERSGRSRPFIANIHPSRTRSVGAAPFDEVHIRLSFARKGTQMCTVYSQASHAYFFLFAQKKGSLSGNAYDLRGLRCFWQAKVVLCKSKNNKRLSSDWDALLGARCRN